MRFGYFPQFKLYSPDDIAGGGAPSGDTGGAPSGGSPAGGSASPSPSYGAPGAQSQEGAPGSTGSPADQGPVDYNRFNEVNTKYNTLRWAEGLDPTTVSEATNLWDWFDTDPDGAYDYLSNMMKRAGRIPAQPSGGGNGAAEPFTDPKTGRPLADVRIAETGQRFYSAEQADKLVEWKAQQLATRLDKLEGQQTHVQARSEARQLLQEAESSWPAFPENIEAIFAELQRDRRLSLDGAYRRVVVQSGKLEAFHRKKMGMEMQQNGRAGQGGGNPQGQAPTHTADLGKLPIKELFRREMRRRGLGR